MKTTLIVIGLVIVLLSSVVGWSFHANPDLGPDNPKGFLFGLFGLPALVGLVVLFVLLAALKWFGMM